MRISSSADHVPNSWAAPERVYLRERSFENTCFMQYVCHGCSDTCRRQSAGLSDNCGALRLMMTLSVRMGVQARSMLCGQSGICSVYLRNCSGGRLDRHLTTAILLNLLLQIAFARMACNVAASSLIVRS